jgi:hypothetical protein
MRQTALLEFESSAFAILPGEDEQTNPEIYGKALAHGMVDQLAARGYSVGQLIAEDFGWCVPLESKSPRLYVACASVDGTPNHWRVLAFAEGATWGRLFGKDTGADALAALFAAVKQALQSNPAIHGLREEAT